MFPYLEPADVDQWRMLMFIVSAAGATMAMMWPLLIKIFKKVQFDIVDLDAVTTRLEGQLRDRGRIRIAALLLAAYLLVGAVIGIFMSVLGFVGLMGSQSDQLALQATGVLSYFSAAAAGFSGAAVFEEALKKQ